MLIPITETNQQRINQAIRENAARIAQVAALSGGGGGNNLDGGTATSDYSATPAVDGGGA